MPVKHLTFKASMAWGFLGIEFCGVFNTFSTFGIDLSIMIQNKQWHKVIGYAIASITISFFAFYFIMQLFT